MSIFDEISQKLQRADGEAVAALVHSAAAEYPPADILSKGLLSGMNTVGEKFRKKDCYGPQAGRSRGGTEPGRHGYGRDMTPSKITGL